MLDIQTFKRENGIYGMEKVAPAMSRPNSPLFVLKKGRKVVKLTFHFVVARIC